jgi:hypothetical protein
MNIPTKKKNIDLGRYPHKKKPNFFIIGAARCGTTSLYHYLSKSPDIYMSPVKEPHFFARVSVDDPKLKKKPRKGKRYHSLYFADEKEYLSLFDEAAGCKAIGEASPSYLYDEETPLLIKNNIPDARFIAVLRDPIERAYSHYWLDVRNGNQPLGFYDALVEDYAKKEKGWGVSHLYTELGFYYAQLKRYYDLFDASQILVIPFDLLKKDPFEALKKVSEHLGVDDGFIAAIDVKEAYNVFRVPRGGLFGIMFGPGSFFSRIKTWIPDKIKSTFRDYFFVKKTEKPLLDPRAREFLESLYRSDLLQLRDFLGEEFDFFFRD